MEELEKSGNDIVRDVMKQEEVTQTALAKKMGYDYQGNISTMINSRRMSLDKFTGMLAAMGYKVAVFKESEEDVRRWIVKRGE